MIDKSKARKIKNLTKAQLLNKKFKPIWQGTLIERYYKKVKDKWLIVELDTRDSSGWAIWYDNFNP